MTRSEPRSPGGVWATMSMLDGGKCSQAIFRSIAMGGVRDLAALQAPWLLAGKVIGEVFNGGLQTTVSDWLYKQPYCSNLSSDSRSSAVGKRSSGGQLREAQAVWNEGLECEKKLELVSAIAAFTRATELYPGDAVCLSRLSKQWSDISYEDGTTPQEAKEANTKALELANKALEFDPQQVLGHIAVCVSKGRLAMFSDNKTKVRLAREAEDSAKRALEIDPNSDLAHHLMGRWHYEMAELNPLARVFVRLVYGTALSPGSYHGALDELVVAGNLAPNRVIHSVQLGKIHIRLGNREKAIKHLKSALEMEIEDLNDYLERREAERLLNRLTGGNSVRWQQDTPGKRGAISFPLFSDPARV